MLMPCRKYIHRDNEGVAGIEFCLVLSRFSQTTHDCIFKPCKQGFSYLSIKMQRIIPRKTLHNITVCHRLTLFKTLSLAWKRKGNALNLNLSLFYINANLNQREVLIRAGGLEFFRKIN